MFLSRVSAPKNHNQHSPKATDTKLKRDDARRPPFVRLREPGRQRTTLERTDEGGELIRTLITHWLTGGCEMRTATLLLTVVAMLVVPDSARAQDPTRAHQGTNDLPLSSHALLVAQGQPIAARQTRDSLWNGLISGAAVGAVLGGLMGRTVEVNNRHSGQGATVTGALMGAGFGAGTITTQVRF